MGIALHLQKAFQTLRPGLATPPCLVLSCVEVTRYMCIFPLPHGNRTLAAPTLSSGHCEGLFVSTSSVEVEGGRHWAGQVGGGIREFDQVHIMDRALSVSKM